MNLIEGGDTNLAAQLWISARYIQAFSFLVATSAVHKEINYRQIIPIYGIISFILIGLILLDLFPDCYIENMGLTTFKIVSEYLVIFSYIISIYMLYHYKNAYSPKIRNLVTLSLIISIFSEFFFTLYHDPFTFFNLLGHVFKAFSFFFLYKAVIERGVKYPFSTLFKKLSESESSLAEKAQFLEESEKKIRLTFENAADVIIWVDFDTGLIVNCNKAAEILFEKRKEELIGFHQKLIHPKSNDVLCIYSKKEDLKDGDIYNSETFIITKSGKTIPVQVVATITNIGDKKILQGFFRDFSKRKKIQQELKDSEEKYKILVENAQEGIWALGADARTTYANKRMAEILGYTTEEMMGKYLFHFMDEKGKKIAEEKLKLKKKGIIEQHDFEFIKKDGSKIHASLETSPLLNEDGEYTGALACVADITDRVKAERIIRDLSKFPSEDPNPVLRMTKNSITYTNKAGERLFKIKAGDPIPNLLTEEVLEVFKKQQIRKIEFQLSAHYYSLIFIPVEGADYVNIYGMDISERVKAEERLKKLITTLSHELRTPITVLSMAIENFKEKKNSLTPELEFKLFKNISRNIKLLTKLADYLLNIFMIDERKLDFQIEEYHPFQILKEIFSFLIPIYENRIINYTIDVDENLILEGDPMRIDQIFRIIIDNAIKYSNNGCKLKIKAIDEYKGKYNCSNRPGVLFIFRDKGMGIIKEEQTKIFQRFYRSKKVSEISGTGLGLSIAKEFIELHEGEIYLESEYEKGSTFYIFLPKL